MSERLPSLRGPIELEATCACGADLRLSDEYDTTCPGCGRVYRVTIWIGESVA
jgi:hypothetical protein